MASKPSGNWKSGGSFATSGPSGPSPGPFEHLPNIFAANNTAIHKSFLGWRMAVLPFRAAGDAASFSIAFGMAEEISAAISRFRSPRLIAPATFWDGIGPAEDVLGRCRMYELDYVMDGTIHVEGGDLRVSVVLLDVLLDFEVIWNGTLSGSMDDLLALQHRIAAEVVKQLDPDLFERASPPESVKQTTVPAAHRFVLDAIQGIYRLDRPRFTRARGALTEAIVLDPCYAAAYTWLAYWSLMAVGLGWADDPQQVMELAGVSAQQAIKLNPSEARAFSVAGHVKSYFEQDVAGASELHARAINLNPNLPIAWALSSASKTYGGDHLSAIRHANIARTLSPRDPHLFLTEHIATWAHFFNKDIQQAGILSEVVLAKIPDHISALNVHIAILGHSDRVDEARHWVDKLQSLNPSASVSSTVARAPWSAQDQVYFAAGLRRAGVPN